MVSRRTEARWFFVMIGFLLLYCFFLFVFRFVLLGVENRYQVDVFKPEPAQVFVMSMLIVLYHFCFVGFYFFSQGERWQKFVAIAASLFITGGLLYGFIEWYHVASKPFFLMANIEKLPWYAEEKTKFLITNGPLIFFILSVFVFRIMMMFQRDNTSDQ